MIKILCIVFGSDGDWDIMMKMLNKLKDYYMFKAGHSHKAFTLMEMMLVVTIVGVMALFAIPGYNRSRSRSFEKIASANLIQLHAAQKAHYARVGDYWPFSTAGNVSILEEELKISLVDSEIIYYCTRTDGVAGNDFFCFANANSGEFILEVNAGPINEKKDGCTNDCNPNCNSGTCPTL